MRRNYRLGLTHVSTSLGVLRRAITYCFQLVSHILTSRSMVHRVYLVSRRSMDPGTKIGVVPDRLDEIPEYCPGVWSAHLLETSELGLQIR